MCRAVLWRRVENTSALLVPFLATAVSFASILRAESIEPTAANPVPTPQSCQEQFLLGRKANAQLALQQLRRCSATYNASVNMEEFTLWYVTLPANSASQQNAWFGNVWRNNLQILTAAPISVPKQEAVGVLDAAIGRGLTRAKREDLAAKWLASHDPAIIAEAASPGVPAQTQTERAQQSNSRIAQSPQLGQPASDKTVADPPRIDLATKPATYHPASRPRRLTRGLQPWYAGPDSFRPNGYDVPQNDPLIDELNRAQLQAGARYPSGETRYGPPRSQPYTAFSGQPASSFAAGAVQQAVYPPAARQQPASAPTSPQQSAYSIPQPQASYAASSRQAAYLPLPLQIEANINLMLQQFATGVNTLQSTVQQAISRQLRRY